MEERKGERERERERERGERRCCYISSGEKPLELVSNWRSRSVKEDETEGGEEPLTAHEIISSPPAGISDSAQ